MTDKSMRENYTESMKQRDNHIRWHPTVCVVSEDERATFGDFRRLQIL